MSARPVPPSHASAPRCDEPPRIAPPHAAPHAAPDAAPSAASARILPDDHGARLDAALARLLPLLELPPGMPAPLPPDAGLRARRRLWQTHAVLLDGRPAGPGARVRAGQMVELRPLGATPGQAHDTARNLAPTAGGATGNPADAPRVLAEAHGLVALYKPGGLHSAAIAGSAAPSVEALLPVLLGSSGSPGTPDSQDAPGVPRLLNRLDGPTSGILLAARTPQAADHFHAAEDSGRAAKTYLALAHGVLEHPVTVRRALDTANRATTRVLPDDSPDPLRHTEVTPLGVMDAGEAAVTAMTGTTGTTDTTGTTATTGDGRMPATPCTLVRCVIRKGARHQIRAHLAALGHPIVGDARYGGPDAAGSQSPATQQTGPPPGSKPERQPAESTLFLHHARIELPDFGASCPPPWLRLLPPELQEAARTAYRPDS
ncbi:pseudouridine synthase family protein [Nitratidesulfovibrio sp. 1201_IL3209]|uniref:pseudouridine synthase family protein n=1 Tax=Nitratidesulfovibrio sp. 1201_IL3209 TaxID=3084053 RepID=UPI002FD9AB88